MASPREIWYEVADGWDTWGRHQTKQEYPNMAASESLNGQQFRTVYHFVHHSELAKMYSADFDTPMTQARASLRASYADAPHPHDESVHPADARHGGPDNYLRVLHKDIAANGLREPITVRGGNVVTDGHHRAIVAMDLKMPQIPVRHIR